MKTHVRWQDYKAYRATTSRWVAGLLVVGVIAASALPVAVFFEAIELERRVIGVELLLLGAVTALLLIITYGSSFFPYRSRKTYGTQALEKLQDQAEFQLIGCLGAKVDSLEPVMRRVFATRAGTEMLQRLELEAEDVTTVITNQLLPHLKVEEWLTTVLNTTEELGATASYIEHAIAGFLLQPQLKSYLRTHDLQEQDVGFVTWWLSWQREQARARSRWWDARRLLAFSGIGLSWTSGYTPFIDRFTRIPRGNLWDQVSVGKEEYVDRLVATLARERQSNVLLVGQPGTGRLGVVRALAERIDDRQAHPALVGQRVLYLHVGELLAQGTTDASQLALISQALSEMERAGNIVAIIDGLGSILAEQGEQRLNLTEVLLPFFASLTVRVVVILSNDEYHLRLKTNEELIHFFEVIQIPSASEQVALQELALMAPTIERHNNIYLPYKALRATVEGTQGILQHIPYPERAFDVLEEALVTTQAAHNDTLSADTVNQLLTQKVGVPIGNLAERERTYLLDLEERMHTRIVNQKQAVQAVARAMIRARAGVRNQKRPIGTFLFLGPTGVGKTETAKTLAAVYFGSEKYMLRLDMSEFQSPEAIDKLIGNMQHPVGRLTQLITDHPFSVLLLDEFEKAHPAVQQLFLQVFDEGHLTDARGQTVSFQHAIIIATSNAGADLIWESLDRSHTLPAGFNEELTKKIINDGIFKPELLNRFDGVITFTPLSPQHIRDVARLMLAKLNQRLDIEQGVTVLVTEQLISFLMEIGYNPEFGARPMIRAIQDTIEYAVAQKVLKREVQPGQEIVLDPRELQGLRV